MEGESRRCPDCGEPLGPGEMPHIPEECIQALRLWIDVLRTAVKRLSLRISEAEDILGILGP